MIKVTFDRDRCKGCRLCTEFCPKKIVVMDTENIYPATITNEALCTGCTSCAKICPDCVITIERVEG
jgi:2-oxoglutarate ferredoxin oxidoreductase subunit delta